MIKLFLYISNAVRSLQAICHWILTAIPWRGYFTALFLPGKLSHREFKYTVELFGQLGAQPMSVPKPNALNHSSMVLCESHKNWGMGPPGELKSVISQCRPCGLLSGFSLGFSIHSPCFYQSLLSLFSFLSHGFCYLYLMPTEIFSVCCIQTFIEPQSDWLSHYQLRSVLSGKILS